MIQKIFTATNSRNWVELLDPIMKEYNNTKHRTIDMTPTEACQPENETKVLLKLSKPESNLPKKPKFKVGDLVRISRIKQTFAKGHQHNYSYEVFTVSQILDTNPVTYKIVDYDNDPIEGSFTNKKWLKHQSLIIMKLRKF